MAELVDLHIHNWGFEYMKYAYVCVECGASITRGVFYAHFPQAENFFGAEDELLNQIALEGTW